MATKVLVTTTSFQDTPGKHHDLLNAQRYELTFMRGPLKEDELLPIIDQFDAVLCGDDEYTQAVLEKGKSGRLKWISKYGVGLDKVDLTAAEQLQIPVTNCPGVNQVSVAEHVLALLLSFEKNIHLHHQATRNRMWKRFTGNEIFGKTIGIIGFGAIGKEVAKRTVALGMPTMAYDIITDANWSNEFPQVDFVQDLDSLFAKADVITLHLPHTPDTEFLIDTTVVQDKLKNTPVLINTSRGMLVDPNAIIQGLDSGKLRGYLADVLIEEPITQDEILANKDHVLISPHVGSRTFQSVERQGVMAVENLIKLVGFEN